MPLPERSGALKNVRDKRDEGAWYSVWSYIDQIGQRYIIKLMVAVALAFLGWLVYTAVTSKTDPSLDNASAATLQRPGFCSQATPSLDPSKILLGCTRQSPTRFYITSLDTARVFWDLRCEGDDSWHLRGASTIGMNGLSSTAIPAAHKVIQGARECSLLLTISLLPSGRNPRLLVEFFGTDGRVVRGTTSAHG